MVCHENEQTRATIMSENTHKRQQGTLHRPTRTVIVAAALEEHLLTRRRHIHGGEILKRNAALRLDAVRAKARKERLRCTQTTQNQGKIMNSSQKHHKSTSILKINRSAPIPPLEAESCTARAWSRGSRASALSRGHSSFECALQTWTFRSAAPARRQRP